MTSSCHTDLIKAIASYTFPEVTRCCDGFYPVIYVILSNARWYNRYGRRPNMGARRLQPSCEGSRVRSSSYTSQFLGAFRCVLLPTLSRNFIVNIIYTCLVQHQMHMESIFMHDIVASFYKIKHYQHQFKVGNCGS